METKVEIFFENTTKSSFLINFEDYKMVEKMLIDRFKEKGIVIISFNKGKNTIAIDTSKITHFKMITLKKDRN